VPAAGQDEDEREDEDRHVGQQGDPRAWAERGGDGGLTGADSERRHGAL
jgi:hypothetical protein